MKHTPNLHILLRQLSFSLMGLLVLLLVVATFVEKLCGTGVAMQYFYTAPWTIALWACVAILCIIVSCKSSIVNRPLAVLFLHLAFAVILAGALLTHLTAKEGTLRLRIGDSAQTFLADDGTEQSLPFALRLDTFYVEFYPGTRAPMDYVSRLSVLDTETKGEISMNHIFCYRHFRFYQTRYDADARGTTYTVASDPYGIALTYTGYLLLLFSMVAFFFQKNTGFRLLLARLKGKTLVIMAMGILSAPSLHAGTDTRPHTLQPGLADSFGNLYVSYGDRVCPVNTLAVDFCTKLCGKPAWKGLSANQVLTGWLFYYDEWKNEPMIKIKGSEVRRALHTREKYVSLAAFYDLDGYRLSSLLLDGNTDARSADEKVQLLSMVATGSVFKIFPHADSLSSSLHWYSWTDPLPQSLSYAEWQFERNVMDYVALHIMEGKNIEANEVLLKLRKYQIRNAADKLPAEKRIRAEILYQRLVASVRPIAVVCMVLGLLFFGFACFCLARGQRLPVSCRYMAYVLLSLLFSFLLFLFCLRWYVAGHFPVANGFETMQFLALSALFVTLFFSRRFSLLLPFGCLFSGMALMVSVMGASNPRITLLMPVLQSPLLSIHVAVIMLAYALLAFLMLNGIAALLLAVSGRDCRKEISRLQTVSRLLLYPAVFCLTIGIFVGAVWANVSWGTYWGWDPKEVWALVTMLVYSFPLHSRSLRWLQKPLVFHTYMVLAFLSVLFTYFGVNFFLGGMHAYA